MEHSHYPFATQDWSLIRHRALTLQAAQVRTIESLKGELWVTIDGNSADFFVKSGETLKVPCNIGHVVIEPTSATAMLRVSLAAQSPLVTRIGPSFSQAFAVSVLQPIASLLCHAGTTLRKLAIHLDPKLARA